MNIKKSEWWPSVIVHCGMDIGFIEPENTEIPLCCCFCNWYVSKIHRYHILYENNKSVHVPESYFNSQYKPWHMMIRYIISNLEDSYLIIFLSLLFSFNKRTACYGMLAFRQLRPDNVSYISKLSNGRQHVYLCYSFSFTSLYKNQNKI